MLLNEVRAGDYDVHSHQLRSGHSNDVRFSPDDFDAAGNIFDEGNMLILRHGNTGQTENCSAVYSLVVLTSVYLRGFSGWVQECAAAVEIPCRNGFDSKQFIQKV
jgi:hypothetical protein